MGYLDSTNGNIRQLANQSGLVEEAALLLAIPTAAVADIAASTDIIAVPAEFANLAAVQTYLADAGVVPNIESRLDTVEAKVNDLLAKLRTAKIITP